MSLTNSVRSALAVMALLVVAGSASAQIDLGPQRGGLTSSSQLNLTGNILSAIQIDISTASGGATVVGGTGSSSTGIFSVDFGNLNGLNLGSSATGVTATEQSGGVLYSSPIKLTPRFSGLLSNNASVAVYVDALATNIPGLAAAREGANTGSMGSLSPVLPNIFTTTANNGVPITRYVGLFVGGLSGTGVLSGTTNVRYVYQLVSLP